MGFHRVQEWTFVVIVIVIVVIVIVIIIVIVAAGRHSTGETTGGAVCRAERIFVLTPRRMVRCRGIRRRYLCGGGCLDALRVR